MPIAITAWLWSEPQLERFPTPRLVERPAPVPRMAPPQVIDLKDLEEITPSTNIPVIEYSQPFPHPTTAFEPTLASPPALSKHTVSSNNETFVVIGISYLPWLWLIGTPLTFVLLSTGLIGSQRLRRHSKAVLEGPLFEACQRVRQSLVSVAEGRDRCARQSQQPPAHRHRPPDHPAATRGSHRLDDRGNRDGAAPRTGPCAPLGQFGESRAAPRRVVALLPPVRLVGQPLGPPRPRRMLRRHRRRAAPPNPKPTPNCSSPSPPPNR